MKKSPTPTNPSRPTRPNLPAINLTEISTTIEGLIRETQQAERERDEAREQLKRANEEYNVLTGFVDGFLTPAWRAKEPKFEIQPRLLANAAKAMAREMLAKQPAPTSPSLRQSSTGVRTKPLEVVPEQVEAEPEAVSEPQAEAE